MNVWRRCVGVLRQVVELGRLFFVVWLVLAALTRWQAAEKVGLRVLGLGLACYWALAVLGALALVYLAHFIYKYSKIK